MNAVSLVRLSLASLLLSLALGGQPRAADWRTASREPVGLAPDPAVTREAIVQIYAARTIGWRGRFAVHSWIAVKPTDAPAWTVYEVIGWRKYRGLPPLSVSNRPPDGRWFGAAPEVLFERRGEGVDAVIEGIAEAARAYPFADDYLMWPGPNSNTFIAYVIRSVPDLACDLPPTAIGKDFLVDSIVARAPSGTGFQVSLWGVLGVLVGAREGVEINVLGLVFGVDPDDRALKLPIVGRVKLSGS
jgi:Protein of unknown function (DUF3750)